MFNYLISYDLIKYKDYEKLTNAIVSISKGCVRPLESVWIIKHEGKASDIRNTLKPYIDSDDKLLVVKLTREAAWTSSLDQEDRDWLKSYL